MKKFIFTFFLLSYLIEPAFGQTRVWGIVKDQHGQKIPGANVYLEGTYDGTSTDVEGFYDFSTEETGEQKLIVSFVGYKRYLVAINIDNEAVERNIVLEEEVSRMDEIVISAGSFEGGGESKREVLNPMDIVTTAGATADLAATLNTLPGTQSVGEQGRVFVRGGEGAETRTYIDGMAVLNEYSPTIPNTPSRSRFLPFMFKGVSFSTGGYSAEYGQALSSVLILNSKDETEINRGDISLMSVGMDLAYTRAWNGGSATGKVQYTDLSPYFGVVTQTTDWQQAPRSFEGAMALRQRVKGDGMLKFYSNINQSTLRFYDHPLEGPATGISTDLTNSYLYLNASYKDYFQGNWFVNSGISYTRSLNNIKVGGFPLENNDEGVHVKTNFIRDLSDRVSLRTGGELFHSSFVASNGAGSTVKIQQDNLLPAAWLEWDIRLTKTLAVRAGGRLEYLASTRDAYLAPRVSMGLKTGEFSQVSAAFGHFYQNPMKEYRILSPSLIQERADHYLLNYQILKERRTFRIETYYKHYDNLAKESISDDAGLGYNNSGYGYATGMDLFWRDAKSIRNLDYWLSFSFLDTKRLYQDFPSVASPGFSSVHNFSAVTKYFWSLIRTQLGLTYRFASGRPYTDPNLGGFQDQRTPAYHDVSINLSYLISNNIIIHSSISNVLGVDNVFGYEYTSTPDELGVYAGRPITLPAPRFIFLGIFITLTKENLINQLPNL